MNKLLRFKAIFLMVLVVMIPFYISSVFAANSLEVTRYSGEGGANGYFKNYDKWVFDVIANIDGDSAISTNQVKIQDVNTQSCVSVSGGFKCSYSSDYYSFPDGTYPVSVRLLSDSGAEILTRDVSMTTDKLVPIVNFESIAQRGMNVSVLFTVKDRAYIEDDFTKCSGISLIEFYDNANLLKTINVNSSQCTYSGSEALTRISSDRVIIKAYDKLGQIGSASSPQIEFDFVAPIINPATFKILKNGADMGNYLSSMPDTVGFSVDITEDKGLMASNVYADFSSLAGSAKVAANSCSREEEAYTCIWNNAQVNSASISIPVVAEDNVGNSASAALSKTVSVDNSGPIISFIGTDRIFGENSFISTTADILVKISETGSGINPNNVRLDISGLNPAYRDVMVADNCVKSGNNYNCYWYNKTTTLSHNGRATLYLITLADNAGNAATGPSQGAVIVDKQAPTISGVKLESVSELGITEVLKSNDDLNMFGVANDPSGLKAYGNFTSIRGGGYENLEAICELAEGKFNCLWEIPSIFSGYLNTSVVLKFVDTAGNAAFINVPVVIYGLEEEEAPNYWSYGAIDKMPSSLDRQTTSMINQKTYFHIPLISSQNAYALSIGLGECSGENIDFIESTEIINNYVGSKDPYVIITLKTTDARINAINANCSLRITSLYNNKVSNVEYESVPLTIEFYNMPLTEASESLDKRINDMKDDWLESWFWDAIGLLQALNDLATLICQGYQIFRVGYSVLQTITTIWGHWEELAWGTIPPYGPGITAVRQNLCGATEDMRDATNAAAVGFFEKFCAMANCKLGPLPEGQEVGWFEWWGTVIGGGGGLAAPLSEVDMPVLGPKWYERYTGKQAFGASGFMNVKDSLVLSTLTLCVPGMVYNLEKMRQIACMHIGCLEQAGDTGMPATACDASADYMVCKYIWGEVFQFFPITAFIDYFLGKVRTAFSSPFTMAGSIISLIGCKSLCAGPEPVHSACIWIKIFADIGDAISNADAIGKIIENDWKVRGYDYCADIGESVVSGLGNATATT